MLHGGIIKSSFNLVEMARSFLKEFRSVKAVNAIERPTNDRQVDTRWSRPRPGSLKLNTDAAIKPGRGFVGLGGVIRNEHGQVLATWALKCEASWDVNTAELMSIKEGLMVARQLQLRVNSTENDSANAIQEINGDFPFSPQALVVHDIKALLSVVGHGNCSVIRRSANEVAHTLAISVLASSRDRVWADCCPLFIAFAVSRDIIE